MKVIDISDWNDRIDWFTVINGEIEGVIVKISEGRTLADLYERHIAACVEHGLKWGVYAFTHAQTTERAEEEAAVVCDALEGLGYGKPELGIWFDVESDETVNESNEDVTAICSAFISTCNSRGYSAGIYANYDVLTKKINCYDLADYVPFWVAQYYAKENSFKVENPDLRVIAWQFTDSYVIDGDLYDLSEWEE